MPFKCKKCLRIKPAKFFTITIGKEKICDVCCSGIEAQRVEREAEIKRDFDCENKTPILTGYAETKSAKATQKTRNDIADIVEARRLAKELDDYE